MMVSMHEGFIIVTLPCSDLSFVLTYCTILYKLVQKDSFVSL